MRSPPAVRRGQPEREAADHVPESGTEDVPPHAAAVSGLGASPYSEGSSSATGLRRARDRAMFPFGHGLSYTTFRIAPATAPGRTATAERDGLGDGDQHRAPRRRRGGRSSTSPAATEAVPQPPRQLGGWARVALEPGERRRVGSPSPAGEPPSGSRREGLDDPEGLGRGFRRAVPRATSSSRARSSSADKRNAGHRRRGRRSRPRSRMLATT